MKTFTLHKSLLSLALGAALIAAGASTFAQTYPAKPVSVVVPFAAGGPTDVVARALADVMTKNLGQSVIVDNRAGAGGTVGTNIVAKAQADGYTLLLMHIGFTTAPSLYRKRKLPYDVTKDFEPVGLIVDVPMTIIAHNDVPAKNYKEFEAYLRNNTSKINMANAGVGSASHLCGMLLTSTLNLNLTTVPYGGTGPAMTALRGKQVDFMCDQSTNTTSQINSKSVKAIAVTSAKRMPTLPDVPTLDESGLKKFQLGVWHGLWAPKGTPKPVLDKLVASLQSALEQPIFRGRMQVLGATVYDKKESSPAALDAQVKGDLVKWAGVIEKAGVFAE